MGSQRSHFAYVWIRGTRLGMEVVSIVPDNDQTQVTHGRVDRRPGADHEGCVTAQRRQPPSVPLSWAKVCGQRNRVDARSGEGLGHAVHIAMVWHHDDATSP